MKRRGLSISLALVLLSGCASATPSNTPTPSAATGATLPTPISLPSGWTVVHPGDPALTFAEPAGWTEYSLADYRAQAVALMQQETGDAVELGTWILADIDGHRLRYSTIGPSSNNTSVTLDLLVSSSDATLEAAATREISDVVDHHLGAFVSRSDTATALGPAVHLRFEGKPAGDFLASQTVEYIIRRTDGSTLTITSTSVAEDTGFEALLQRIVATFGPP